MDKNPSFNLMALAELIGNGEICLPPVQRGFVWKPSQIEAFWDSLLRGYPVGAIVLAPRPDGRWELLDGQQRLTALCLGLGAKTLRGTETHTRVFYDLAPPSPDRDDPRRHIFRVITRSHPWGYQRSDPAKTLEQSAIRKACELYGVDDPWDRELEHFFPYDAKAPIPFEYFIGADSPKAVWDSAESIVEKLRTHRKSQPDDLRHLDDDNAVPQIANVLGLTRRMLEAQHIPALYLDLDVFHSQPGDTRLAPTKGSEEAPDDDRPDEIETLFVRLNAGGTPLRGEELNYSILKSHIEPALQQQIEKACGHFFDPARFVSIAYRLYLTKGKAPRASDGISLRIRPKQFQRAMADAKQRAGFVQFVGDLLKPDAVAGEGLLAYLKRVLLYDRDSLEFGLPYPVVMRLSDDAPEIAFLLLYRIWLKEDRFPGDGDADLHRRMLGVVTLLAWLGKESGKKGFRRLLNNVWPAATVLDAPHFWSAATIRRAQIEDVFPALPTTKELRAKAKKLAGMHHKAWPKAFDELLNDPFAARAFWCRSLLLYAQREFIGDPKRFPEPRFDLVDTDVPFDWDHIAPRSWIDGKRGIPEPIRHCFNLIGNLRAWPYSLNRMDHDAPPAKKLDLLGADDHSCPEFEEWLMSHDLPGEREELKSVLLGFSACDDEWAGLERPDNLKRFKSYRPLCELIIQRSFRICEHWYESLDIEALVPAREPLDFVQTLNRSQWKELTAKSCPDGVEIVFDSEIRRSWAYWVKRLRAWPNTYLYFGGLPRDEEDSDPLADDAIEFGIIDVGDDDIGDRLKITEQDSARYLVYEGNCLGGLFTLISDDTESHRRLIGELCQWLRELPLAKGSGTSGKALADEFMASVRQEFA
jgi:hypothetical protein